MCLCVSVCMSVREREREREREGETSLGGSRRGEQRGGCGGCPQKHSKTSGLDKERDRQIMREIPVPRDLVSRSREVDAEVVRFEVVVDQPIHLVIHLHPNLRTTSLRTTTSQKCEPVPRRARI